MNILVLNWRDMKHPQAGGAEVHFQELFRRLVLKGHTVSLLCTRAGDLAKEDLQDGIRVYRWGHTYAFNWEAPFLIRRLMRTCQFDCIVDDVNKIPFFTPRWFPRVRTCAFFHHLFGHTIFSLAPYPMACYVLALERLSGWGYAHVPCCTVSRSTADDLIRHGFSADNISIIENSVDTGRFSPAASPGAKESDVLLYTGRLKKYKNVGSILEAMAVMKAKGRMVRLIIAGAGDDEMRLKEKASSLAISDMVSYRGFVSEEEKITLLKRATLFVNPSHKEGWGITNIEANACGTAVIANDAPGLRDSVRHDTTGLLYRENDRDDMIRCIELLLDNPGKRAALEHGGRAWAETFSWDTSAGKVEKWLTAAAGIQPA